VTMNPAFGMATPSPASTKNTSIPAGPRSAGGPRSAFAPIHKGWTDGPVWTSFLVTRPPYNARSRWRRAQGSNVPPTEMLRLAELAAPGFRQQRGGKGFCAVAGSEQG
jgi:hypothetical protein